MDRIERSKQKLAELAGPGYSPAIATTDPDFYQILIRFIFGEVFFQGKLNDKQRELITLVVLTTNQTLEQIKSHVRNSLNIGLTPVEIKEAIYHCAPYVGFPKAINGLNQANEIFKERNISLPLQSQVQAQENERFEKGLQLQAIIGGEAVKDRLKNAPENQKHIYQYLAEFCFGDFYTRSGLEFKTRELLTLCIVCAQGGCEAQVKGHVKGNLNVGNDKETMIEAITQCLPYMGFPRTLNALNCINEIIP